MNMYVDESVEDQILMTIHNLLKRSVWDDEVNYELVEKSLSNELTSNYDIFQYCCRLHIDKFINMRQKHNFHLIKLTDKGKGRIKNIQPRYQDSKSIRTNSYNIQIDSIYMDVFRNIQNATIINKSNVQNAFNKLEKYDKETSQVLIAIAESIENSKDHSAGILFDNFTQELNKQEPNKFKLKNIWSSIIKILPTINTFSTSVEKITELFK